MKKILLLVLFLFITILRSEAQPEYRNDDRGALRVRLVDNYPITIALDGRYFEKHGPSLTVGDLPRGKHFLKIYTFTPEEGREARAHLVYEGRVKVFEGTVTSLVYDPTTGDMRVSRGDEGNMPGPGRERVRGRMQQPYGAEAPAYGAQQPIDTVPAIKVPENVVVPESKLTKPAYAQISKDALTKLGVKVIAKPTDTDKLKELRSALAKKAISTDQLKSILIWLDFEGSRVEFAKWIFPNITDKKNFTDIVDKMKYQESKEELNQFLTK